MATTRPTVLVKTLRMSTAASAEPIIDNPKLKAMTAKTPVRRRIGGKMLEMPEAPQPVAGTMLMASVPARPPAADHAPRHDQIARETTETGGEPNSVRLRLRIVNGVASVISAHVVPGVLPVPERLDYGLAYEITNGKRRVALGSVPDVGMRRSYPDPQGRPGMQGHHLQELDSIEVNLRLPQHEFSAAALPKLHVQLFRMKAQPPARPITAAPLAEQFGDQLRVAAELKGIELKKLSPRVQSAVESAVFAAPVKVRATR